MKQKTTGKAAPSLKSIAKEEADLIEKIRATVKRIDRLKREVIKKHREVRKLRKIIRDYPIDQLKDEEITIAMSALIGDYEDYDLPTL